MEHFPKSLVATAAIASASAGTVSYEAEKVARQHGAILIRLKRKILAYMPRDCIAVCALTGDRLRSGNEAWIRKSLTEHGIEVVAEVDALKGQSKF